MPSTFAHYHFGNLVLAGLDTELQEKIVCSRKLFSIGVHGPDILFHFRPLYSNRINAEGHEMHARNAYPFFTACRELVASSCDPEAARAYVLGFICHFTLDSACHGYINRQVEETGVSHVELEMEFDKRLMYRQHLDPLKYDTTASLHADAHGGSVIAPFFHIRPEQAEESVASMKRFLTMFRTVRGVGRKAVLYVLDKMGKSEAFAGMFVTKEDNPKCAASNDVLEERLREAVPVARELIRAYLDWEEKGVPLPERFRRNFE